MSLCPTCEKWVSEGFTHKCPPRWRVWEEDTGTNPEDGHVVYATDSEEAAERWAEWYDWSGADYGIVGQRHTPIVSVRREDEPEGKVDRFKVSGEAVPQYSAHFLEPASSS